MGLLHITKQIFLRGTKYHYNMSANKIYGVTKKKNKQTKNNKASHSEVESLNYINIILHILPPNIHIALNHSKLNNSYKIIQENNVFEM